MAAGWMFRLTLAARYALPTRIFERFFRVDKSHSKMVNGTGLGLSIVKHIAMNNHIGIHVDSTLGKGSVFTVDLESWLG